MAAGGEETVAVRPEVVAIGEQRVGGTREGAGGLEERCAANERAIHRDKGSAEQTDGR